MKQNIHPQYHKDAQITCACGAAFNVGSTEKAIHVEICSQCHPFYTGKEKLLDTAGRVDKFKKRMAAAQGFNKIKTEAASKEAPAKAETTEMAPEQPAEDNK